MPPPPSGERLAVLEAGVGFVDSIGPRRLRVVVDSLTASGKTSFGHEIARGIADLGRQPLRAPLDDFKRPWREAHLYDRTSGDGYYRNALDYESVRRPLLDPAGPDRDGHVALCSVGPLTEIDHSTEVTSMRADTVLVVDGVFACRPELDDYWDLRIWLDVDIDISLQRATVVTATWKEASRPPRRCIETGTS